MPTLRWLTRDDDVRAAEKVPLTGFWRKCLSWAMVIATWKNLSQFDNLVALRVRRSYFLDRNPLADR